MWNFSYSCIRYHVLLFLILVTPLEHIILSLFSTIISRGFAFPIDRHINRFDLWLHHIWGVCLAGEPSTIITHYHLSFGGTRDALPMTSMTRTATAACFTVFNMTSELRTISACSRAHRTTIKPSGKSRTADKQQVSSRGGGRRLRQQSTKQRAENAIRNLM
jgi:hypothetical protein